MMFDLKVFLGFAQNELFQKELRETNPYLTTLFIGKEEYLQEISHLGKRYLGKYLPPFPTLDQLEDLEKHLLSLLNKLAPHYPFVNTPPVLVILNDGN
jgi:hypothetical protein